MGRVTSTRDLVREAADKMLAAGLTPNKITVDRIYQEIGQGSRTTINDELKSWRAEQSSIKVAKVPAELEPMLVRLWSAAMEQAEAGFLAERDRVAEELEMALAEADQLHAQNRAFKQECTEKATQIAAKEASLISLREEQKTFAAQVDTERAVAQSRIAELEGKLRESEERARLGMEEAARKVAATQKEAAEQQLRLRNDFEEALARQESLLAQLRSDLEAAAERNRQLENQLGAAQAQHGALEREREGLAQQLVELRKELDEAGTLVIAGEKKADEALKKQHQLELELTTAQVKLSAREEALSIAEERRRTAEEIYHDGRLELRRLHKQIEELEEKLKAAENKEEE